jgi:hypothetical protein
MRAIDHPGFRFLARCAVFSVATISLWYFALLGPLLGAMRVSTEVLLSLAPASYSSAGITADANGDWGTKISMPSGKVPPWLSQYVPADRPSPRAVAVQLTIPRGMLGYFTLGLPLFWAVLLAAPRSKRFWRALAFGTTILAATALLFCPITIGHAAAPYLWAPGSWIGFALDVASYLGSYAVPYVAPFLLAVLLLPELRKILLPWEPEPEAISPIAAGKAHASRSAPRKL